MVMLIHPGFYEVWQDGKEVGQLIVRDGTPLVQHWYLYSKASATYGAYTVPSARASTGRFKTARVVRYEFKYQNDGSSIALDKYVPHPESELAPVYITATDTKPFTPGAPVQGPLPQVQIDWGYYYIKQPLGTVGALDVSRDGLTERWHLGTSYVPPGSSGGSFDLGCTTTLEIPSGTVGLVEFRCNQATSP